MNFFLRAKCLVLADDTDSQDHQKDNRYYVPLTALWVQDHGECCMKIRACASIYTMICCWMMPSRLIGCMGYKRSLTINTSDIVYIAAIC